MPQPKATLKAFPLRLPVELYRDLERIAEAEIRPVNSQIQVFLREAIERWDKTHTVPTSDTTS